LRPRSMRGSPRASSQPTVSLFSSATTPRPRSPPARLATLYPSADAYAFDAQPSAATYTSTLLPPSPHTSVRSPTKRLGSIFDDDIIPPRACSPSRLSSSVSPSRYTTTTTTRSPIRIIPPPSPSSLFRSSSPSPSPPRRWLPPAMPHQPRNTSGLMHAPPSPLAANSSTSFTSAARPSSSPSYGRRLLGRSLAEWPLTGSAGNAYTTDRSTVTTGVRPSLFDPPADLSSTGLFARPLSSTLTSTGGATVGSALGRAFNSSFGTPLSTAARVSTTGLFGSGAGGPVELDLAQTLAAVKGESSDATLATLQQLLEVYFISIPNRTRTSCGSTVLVKHGTHVPCLRSAHLLFMC